MILHYFKYLLFKLTATNQHGVHSPFLYSLVCSCFYNSNFKKKKSLPINSKRNKLTLSLILENLKSFNETVETEFKIEKFKIIYDTNKSLSQQIEDIRLINTPHLTLIDELHFQREEWNLFILNSKYIIMDLYFYGIIIQRPQQSKEFFSLKVF